MHNSMFVPGSIGFRGFFLVDLTPLVCTRYKVKCFFRFLFSILTPRSFSCCRVKQTFSLEKSFLT